MTAALTCAKCGAPSSPEETFCAKCGFQVQASSSDRRDIGARIGLKHEKQTHQQRVRSGRTTILVVAVLTVLASVVIYFVGMSPINEARAQVNSVRNSENVDPASVVDADAKNNKAAATITLIAGVNLVLGLIYFGLWFWAKSRPLPAVLAALILYVTVWIGSAVIDPASAASGFIMKIIIIAFLIKSIDSARKYQRMQEHGV